jgi:hypothetical protein
MKKVMINYGGNSAGHGDDDYDILDMELDRRVLYMQRVPCIGEGINLHTDKYHIYMEVEKVYTTLDLTADEHFETYRIWLDFAEIVEKYK